MSFSKVHSAQISFLKAHQIDVEVDISRGLYNFSIVGLGDKAVDESKDRVSSAIKNSGFHSPKQKSEKVVVSLAPANSKKHGPLFDVAIALGYLESVGEIEIENKDSNMFLGELALDGSLRKISGTLPLVKFAKEKGFKNIFVPKQNAKEAAVVDGINVYGAENLTEIISHTTGNDKIKKQPVTKISKNSSKDFIDFSDIKGQLPAKRGLEIAAAGGHNIALFGPPGTGKTLLSKAFAGILPDMSFEEILETTSIHSSAGVLRKSLLTERPFRTPHHSASYVAICGGGGSIKPGEVTLAHRGVLFLDEFPEFERKVIDSLRQPLEDGMICISRASGSVCYPSSFILIATLNPCPCGYLGTDIKTCSCSRRQIEKYQQKISGPIVDRIDMWIEVGQIPHRDLFDSHKHIPPASPELKNKISEVHKIQRKRQDTFNSKLGPKDLETFCKLDSESKEILSSAANKLNLSARAFHKVIKLARTIADLEKEKDIKSSHILEALQYRKK
ncbi:YifB family Mg chelatase-like AAA ATPase [Candidatus Pacebacteria bacterium]|nr:YifB family Mg chelatase-like AAA ATPase [Candidatus Paceibacterota bacterium]